MIASVKQSVQDVLRTLPDDCSWEDVMYRLYVRREIEIGRRQSEAGELIDHDQLVEELLSDEDSLDDASATKP